MLRSTVIVRRLRSPRLLPAVAAIDELEHLLRPRPCQTCVASMEPTLLLRLPLHPSTIAMPLPTPSPSRSRGLTCGVAGSRARSSGMLWVEVLEETMVEETMAEVDLRVSHNLASHNDSLSFRRVKLLDRLETFANLPGPNKQPRPPPRPQLHP